MGGFWGDFRRRTGRGSGPSVPPDTSYSVRATQAGSREQLSAVLGNIPDGVITANVLGGIQSFNPAAEKIFGYRAADIIGKPVTILIPPSYAGSHESAVDEYMRTGRGKILGVGPREAAGRRKGGGEFPLDVALSEMMVEGQRFFIAIVRDVTERPRLLDDLVAAKQDAVRANQAKSDFLAGMSHEIRTPLNAMVGFADLLGRDFWGPLTGGQREYLTHIQDAGEMLLGIINGVMDLSRIELGKYEINSRPVDVAKMLAVR